MSIYQLHFQYVLGNPKLCLPLPGRNGTDPSKTDHIRSPSNTFNSKWENQILASLKPSTRVVKSIYQTRHDGIINEPILESKIIISIVTVRLFSHRPKTRAQTP